MLIFPAIVGTLCFLYGIASINSNDNIPSKEICNITGPGNIVLCPLCDTACKYQRLHESCLFSKITYLFDNPSTVFFAIFMSFWGKNKQNIHNFNEKIEPNEIFKLVVSRIEILNVAFSHSLGLIYVFRLFFFAFLCTLFFTYSSYCAKILFIEKKKPNQPSTATTFLELWKRKQALIIWEWDLQNIEDDEESRPEFEAAAKNFRINPVTKEREPYIPTWTKAFRYFVAASVVTIMVSNFAYLPEIGELLVNGEWWNYKNDG